MEFEFIFPCIYFSLNSFFLGMNITYNTVHMLYILYINHTRSSNQKYWDLLKFLCTIVHIDIIYNGAFL